MWLIFAKQLKPTWMFYVKSAVRPTKSTFRTSGLSQAFRTSLIKIFLLPRSANHSNPPACHLWLIASDESGRVVGFSKVNWSTPAPLTGELGAELQKIYFLKSEAGRGYGKQLLHFICRRAIERGERLLWLDVLKTNSNARRFYEGFGFQEIGEIPFKTDRIEIGMVVMACELSR